MDNTALRIVNVFNTIDELVFALFMVSIPFGWQFSVIPLLLLFASLIRKVIISRNLPDRDTIIYFLPLAGFFLVTLISISYSSHAGYGFDLLFRKITLLLLPLLLVFSEFSSKTIRKGLRFYILGVFITALISLTIAFVRSSKWGGGMFCIIPFHDGITEKILDTDATNNFFLGTDLSFFMHPSYFALHIAMAFLIVVFVKAFEHNSLIIKGITLPFVLISGTVLLLLSTNASVLTTILLGFGMIFFAFRLRALLDLKTYWIMFFGLLLLILSTYNTQFLHLVLGNLGESLLTKARITNTSLSLIREHLFWGVGLGDLTEQLNLAYNALGNSDLAELSMNPHNQYLQTWGNSGLLALIFLVGMLVNAFVFGILRRNFLLIAFSVLTATNFFFESMLNRYWGILFFAVFYSLLYFLKEPNDD